MIARRGHRWLLATGRLCAVAAVAFVVGVVVPAVPASAHDALVRTTPADGASMEALPEEIVLTFNQPAQAGGTVIAVTGPSGNVADGAAKLVDSDVRQAVAPGSPAGSYTVDWRVVSADGHPVTGSFTFTAKTGTAGAAPTTLPSAADPRAADPRAADPASNGPGSAAGRGGWLIGAAVVVVLGLGGLLMSRRRGGDAADE